MTRTPSPKHTFFLLTHRGQPGHECHLSPAEIVQYKRIGAQRTTSEINPMPCGKQARNMSTLAPATWEKSRLCYGVRE